MLAPELYCPQCGEDTPTLHEGYCEDCRKDRQTALDAHNAEHDAWVRMTPNEQKRAILYQLAPFQSSNGDPLG